MRKFLISLLSVVVLGATAFGFAACSDDEADYFGSEGLEYTLSNDGTYYIASGIGTCTETDIVIASVYNNLPVTSIGDEAFYNCDTVTNVTISNWVTSIGVEAFYSCDNLTSIKIPDSVTSIGEGAFSACPITSATMPANVIEAVSIRALQTVVITSGDTIPDGAFSGCDTLTSVQLSDSVKNIGEGAFADCPIKNAIIPTNAINAISNSALESIVITSGERIPDEAFSGCSNLTDVSIADSVKYIGKKAFLDCINLNYNTEDDLKYLGNEKNPYIYLMANTDKTVTEVSINANCKFINEGAFSWCRRLTDLILPVSVTRIGDEVFLGCEKLTNVTIPHNITSIGDKAFYDCSSLTSINIPDSTTSIGANAFDNCNSLTNVIIGRSVTIVGQNAFGNCNSLTKISYNGNIESWCNIEFENLFANPLYYAKNLYINNALVTELVIPSTIAEIKDYTFYNCSSVTSVELSDSVTSIGNDAFNGCGLTSIVIPASVMRVGEEAFYNCPIQAATIPAHAIRSIYSKDLQTVVITSGSIIYNDAFFGCGGLTSVEIGDSVTSIGNSAFYDCTSLTSIEVDENNSVYSSLDGNLYNKDQTELIQYAIGKEATEFVIPDSVTSIGSFAFQDCENLTSVEIGGSVTSIEEGAFYNCRKLTDLAISDSVTSIGNYAFYKCVELASITFNGTIEEWNAIPKGDLWKYDVPATEVVCTDGVVSL